MRVKKQYCQVWNAKTVKALDVPRPPHTHTHRNSKTINIKQSKKSISASHPFLLNTLIFYQACLPITITSSSTSTHIVAAAMAEIADILHRDNARGLYNDMLLMHSPRMEGSQIFMGHAITPSSLCKGMDESSQAGLLREVDYEDVFGGPPRFAALMSVPHMDRTPTATLDKTTARQLSLRTSSLPVFDLPVFGDNAFSSTVYEARANSDVYDDTFDEGGPMPDAFSAFNLHGVPMWKASSLSSSRRMSPVHPTVAFASQLGGDETLVVTSSMPICKTRPAAGKFSKWGSLSSVSSFDEISGKLGDGSYTSLRNDAFTSSLPSSPPQSGSFGHLKSIIGSTGSVNVAASTTSPEVDDVFGGFPKRIFPQPLSAVPHDSRTVTDARETQGTRTLEKAGVKSINTESRVCSSSSAAHASETSDTSKCNFSRSSSVNNGRYQHDKELMMDSQTDSDVVEKSQPLVGQVSNIDDDMHLSCQSSFKLPTPMPPPVPDTELKFKSWKDLTSDLPASHSSTSSSIIDLVTDATPPSMATPKEDVVKDKDVAESLAKKQFDKNLPVQQNTENLSQASAAGPKGKVKSAEYTIDLEERELQELLASAWKINEQMERENYNAKFPEEVPKVSDTEPHWEEQKNHSAGQPKSSHIQRCDSVDLDKRDDDINWKEWRKYGRRQRKELSRDVGLDESSSTKDFNFKKQVSAPDMARSLAETGVSLGAAKSRDIEELLKAVTEEALMDRVLASFEVSSDALAGVDSQKKFSKGVSREHANSEYLVKEQALGRSVDFERAASFHGFMSGPSQDFVYNDEQNRLSLCVPVEDAECLIDGFQEVEGETCECRKARWERHMRARERAAKALEEMQHRDAELQRQQEEIHQFSETSDGKIKRWAAGKEGNLRALLSNLQHVLWSECGWLPIPLTDLIEVPDVKKAYRKATLFVHPDKVQQKGASIQQKYIAERVFDILQEAWKTFNMQESF